MDNSINAGGRFKNIGVRLKAHLKIIIPAVCVLAVIIVVACVVSSVLSDKFRAGKVAEIELGYTQEQVAKILGEPYGETKEDYKWEYYDSGYMSVLNKIASNNSAQEKAILSDNENKLLALVKEEEKLLTRLEGMTYKYIEVNFSLSFDGENKVYKVSSVIFDKARNDSAEASEKKVKKIKLPKESAYFFEDVNNLKLSCQYYYSDGSYKYSALESDIVSKIVNGEQNITRKDDWGEYVHSSSFIN